MPPAPAPHPNLPPRRGEGASSSAPEWCANVVWPDVGQLPHELPYRIIPFSRFQFKGSLLRTGTGDHEHMPTAPLQGDRRLLFIYDLQAHALRPQVVFGIGNGLLR